MNNRFSAIILALSVAVFGVAPQVLADPTHNPPLVCAARASCSTCPQPDGCACGCILVTLDLGATTAWTGQTPVYLRIHSSDETASLSTPAQLKVVMGWSFKAVDGGTTAGGAPQIVRFVQPEGAELVVHFQDGDAVGVPEPNNLGKSLARVRMVDAEGWATTSAPAFYDLYPGDGSVWRFLATGNTNERGALVSFTDPRGRVLTPDDFGVDIVRDALGNIRQVKTLTRLADVRTLSPTHYAVTVYPLAEEPEQVADNGLYALPEHAPTRVLDVAQGESVKELLVGFQKGTGDMRQYRYVAVNGDWTLYQPSGLVEAQELYFTEDESGAQRLHTIRDETGKLWSRDEYNYVSAYWGYLITNRIEGIPGDATRTTSWSYYTDGPHKDLLRETVEPTGNRILYEYDDKNRVVRESMPLVEEETLYSYEPVAPSDPPLLCDTRPRCVVRKMQGIEIQRTYYVYGTNGVDVVERVGEQGAAYGGTNVLRTVTTYYPVTGAITDGLIQSVRHEDGTIDNYAYGLTDGVWTETVTHVHEQAPDIVPMRTTRSVRVFNALGQLVDSRTDLCTIGVEDLIPQADWTPIERLQYAYDIDGNEIRREDLAGRLWTAEWAGNCCGKISEMLEDGTRKVYSYDEEGQLTAIQTLSVVENYEEIRVMDRIGRIVMTFITNTVEGVGEPKEQYKFDSLGRVVEQRKGTTSVDQIFYDKSTNDVKIESSSGKIHLIFNNVLGITTNEQLTASLHIHNKLVAGHNGILVYQTIENTPSITNSVKRSYNMLGQLISTEEFAASGNPFIRQFEYDYLGNKNREKALEVHTTGGVQCVSQILYSTQPETGTTLECYDSNQNGLMDFGASDVIAKTDRKYVLCNGALWIDELQYRLVDSLGVSSVPIKTKRIRLTSFHNCVAEEYAREGTLPGVWTIESIARNQNIVLRQTRNADKELLLSTQLSNGKIILLLGMDNLTNSFSYNVLGRLSTHRINGELVEWFQSDENGKLLEFSNCAGFVKRYEYDAFGNVLLETNDDGQIIRRRFDALNREIARSGELNPRVSRYDEFDRLVEQTVFVEPDSLLTGEDSFDFGAISNRLTDTTHFDYAGRHNEITKKTFSDGTCQTFQYDALSRKAFETNGRGIQKRYLYNDAGRLSSVTYSDNSPSKVFQYDSAGRMVVAMVSGVSTNQFWYSNDGLLTNTVQNGLSISTLYDQNGRKIGIEIPGLYHVRYDLDKFGRVLEMTIETNRIDFQYGFGSFRPSQITCGDIIRETQSGLLPQYFDTNICYHLGDGSHLADISYEMKGNKIARRRVQFNSLQTDDECFDYDELGQLVFVSNSVTSGVNKGLSSFSYYSNGARAMSEECGTPLVFSINAMGQYVELFNGSTNALLYDADGNQTNVVTTTGLWHVTYDANNRPVCWKNGIIRVEMQYDYEGRRCRKIVNDQGNVSYHEYYYDGDTCILELVSTTTEHTVYKYYWTPVDGYWSHLVAASIDEGDILVPIEARTRNVLGFLSPSGQFLQQQTYSPFGVKKQISSLVNMPFGWSSEYEDVELGCVYYKYRHYNPITGGWTSRDPVSMFEVANYSMVGNDPVMKADWNGLCDPVVTIGAAIAGAVITVCLTKMLTGDCETYPVGSISYFLASLSCVVECHNKSIIHRPFRCPNLKGRTEARAKYSCQSDLFGRRKWVFMMWDPAPSGPCTDKKGIVLKCGKCCISKGIHYGD